MSICVDQFKAMKCPNYTIFTMSQTTSSYIDILERYKQGILSNSLDNKQLILLTELFVKDKLLTLERAMSSGEDDWMKYLFLGKFIYDQIETNVNKATLPINDC